MRIQLTPRKPTKPGKGFVVPHLFLVYLSTDSFFVMFGFRLMEECGIVMYCDLHAHSRKHNVFIYGCENKRYVEKRLQEQVFPLMLHKNAADKVLPQSLHPGQVGQTLLTLTNRKN